MSLSITNKPIVLPASSTDNTVVRFDGASGGKIQGSVAVLDDTGNLTGLLSATVGASGIKLSEAANAKMGIAVLVAGELLVANTSVTANSRIFLTSNVDGGTPGWLRISARTPAQDFTITSSSVADTSTVAWLIIEPA